MDVLVDTPIWSLMLRRRQEDLGPEQLRSKASLAELIRKSQARVIGPVRQEILSGIREAKVFQRIRDGLRSFEDEPLSRDDYEYAAAAANQCRAAGLAHTPVDVLICAVAKRRGWEIFSLDKDFERYARHLHLALYRQPGT